jgi:hypothetical protein
MKKILIVLCFCFLFGAFVVKADHPPTDEERSGIAPYHPEDYRMQSLLVSMHVLLQLPRA